MQKSFKAKWTKDQRPEQAAYEIISGMTLEQYKQHQPQFLRYYRVSDELAKLPIRVLDFGCGLGRFLYHAGLQFPNWQFVGYDCQAMLRNAHHVWEFPPNVTFQSDWDTLADQKFDLINAEIVLMHVLEPAVKNYLAQFKKMLSDNAGNRRTPGHDGFIGFFHATRETLDDEKTNIWDITFDSGYETVELYYGSYRTDTPALSNAAALLRVKQ